MLKCRKLVPEAFLPSKSNRDAGYDLYSLENYIIKYGEVVKIRTGIAIEIPPAPPGHNAVGLIFDRSSMGSKGIFRLAGVIDQDYRGEIIVCLSNIKVDKSNFFNRLFNKIISPNIEIKAGNRIAQLLIFDVKNYEVAEVTNLSETIRGENGFGSSGI